MTTAARAREAERVAIAYQAILVRIGVETVAEALKLWQRLPPVERAAQVQEWLDEAVRLTMTKRTQAVQVARAYYRLARALRTGKTVADPFRPEPKYVTLAKLRSEFNALIPPQRGTTEGRDTSPGPDGSAPRNGAEGSEQPSSTSGTPSSTKPAGAPVPPAQKPEPAESLEDDASTDGDELVEVEDLQDLREQEEADLRAALEEARSAIQTLGPANVVRQLQKIDQEQPATKVAEQRAEAEQKAGARQAASIERMALNGARSTTWTHHAKDKRAIGYVRYSKTGTPCGWCAMLISRGAVYKSADSALYDDGDLYHDNCHCDARPIFSDEEYESPLFDLNREYSELWPVVTRGYSGKAAVAVWRKYIRAKQKQDTTAAQEAA